jgi:cytoskeletal protein CcmA (bactofilin family)
MTVTIGSSVHIKGELSGNEDISVDGTVDGKITLKGHNLSIGASARIKGEVSATSVIVFGHVKGNIKAEDRVEVTDGGTVDGDIKAPRVVLADGAHFTGKIDMQPPPKPPGAQAPAAEPAQQREAGTATVPKRDVKSIGERLRGSFQKPSSEDMSSQNPSAARSVPNRPAR